MGHIIQEIPDSQRYWGNSHGIPLI